MIGTTHRWLFLFFKVQDWLKPCVSLRISAQGSAIHVLKSELSLILAKAGTPYSANNFAQFCSEVDGASADFRSDFGNGHRGISIKIPSTAVNEEHLKQIDSCKYTILSLCFHIS